MTKAQREPTDPRIMARAKRISGEHEVVALDDILATLVPSMA